MDWLAPFKNSWSLFCPTRSSDKTRNSSGGFVCQNTLLHKKLLLLPRVCCADNAMEVLRTLEEASWDRSDPTMCSAHLNCIVNLIERLPQSSSSQALGLLIRFIESRDTVIVKSALQSLEVG